MLVTISSMSVPICNCFRARRAYGGKITTFRGIPLFDARVRIARKNVSFALNR